MSRRRTRYTVTCSHHSDNAVVRKVVLAYSAEGAADYYTAKGYVVLSVAKGDLVAKAAAAQRHEGGGFRVSQAALREAIATMDLKWPVRLSMSSKVVTVAGADGNHSVRASFGQPFHRIMLKSYLTPRRAGEVLWHELTHAMQAERAAATAGAVAFYDVNHAWNTHARQFKGLYRNSPLEIEAREFESWNNDLPLCG